MEGCETRILITMKQVKIKLSAYEVFAIQDMMYKAAHAELRPDMKNDTIILAENWPIWAKRYASADKQRLKTFTIALSLARIMHLRLQQIPQTFANQSLLDKLDHELTSMDMKPVFQLSLT